MSRVFIFGIAGFCGSHLFDALKENGHYVEGVDLRDAEGPAAKYSHVGKGEWCTLPETRFLKPWDYVFHCAGPAGPANIKPGYALRQIQDLTQAGLDFAQRCGARFIKFSSSEVYGRSDVTLTESTPCLISPAYDARSEYQIGFIAAEQACFSHPHPYVQVLRLFNVVGPRQRVETGCVLPRFCQQALRGEPLTIFGDGSQRRAFMDVSDLTAFCLVLMEKWPESKQIWNVANPENVIEVVALARDVLIAYEKLSRVNLPGDLTKRGFYSNGTVFNEHYRDSVEKHDISIEKAQTLDWSPQIGLNSIIERTLAWHRDMS